MIEATQRKLREAQFFCNHLIHEQNQAIRDEPEAFGFYLSAFLSAARSVSFALQFEEKEKYDAWFPTWLRNRPIDEQELLGFLKDQRNHEQKRGGSEVSIIWDYVSLSGLPVGDRSDPACGFHWFGPPGTPEPQIGVPVRSFESTIGPLEVVGACRGDVPVAVEN